ncbi:hypothetical protein F5Y07DRAFT_369791 [Xylaria sp. FL0933]|nr:hypothetical protein F5Y07DRAFT_369791 [Xylaria sp. FL0933]
MAVGQNVVIAILLVFFAIGIGALVWKGKQIVEHLAHAMFTAKQRQRAPSDEESA